MHTIRHFTMCAALIAAVVAAVAATHPGPAQAAEPAEGQLIDVLTSDAPRAEKAITCKRLAVWGTKDAVPALAALLPDEELTSWARIALEVIPGPEADAALREAMGKTQGRVLIGVINSIGVRRDAGAVDALAGRLQDADAGVASAAAVALGHIGNAAATRILKQSLPDAPPAVRSAVAEGCILCAEKLLAEDKAQEAAALYDLVRKTDLPKQRIVEATRGAILARRSAGVPLLIEQLRSDDRSLLQIGLSTARELPGNEVAEALVAELKQAPPDRAALILLAMADRGDRAALPAVMEAAKDGTPRARIAAIGVLERLGDVSCVPTLLEIATGADEDVAEAARGTLANLPGRQVDADLAARLPEAEGATRRLLIELVGQRRIDATDALLSAADDPDAEIRAAALLALGETVGADNLAVLITRVAGPEKPEDARPARQALRAACIRMPDREACAARLVAAMPEAPLSAQCTMLEILGAMGGSKALEAIGAAAKDASPELQDTASRLLGEWMDVDASPVLLDLAKTAPEEKYKIRAVRGYIRLVRQFTVPDQQRAEMCRAVLAVAERDAEKKLVLEVMQRYPSLDMLRLAVDLAKAADAAGAPAAKAEAAAVSLAIAQKIGGRSGDVQKLLAQVGHDPVKVEIIKAEYGAGTKFKDVTETLQRHASDFPLIVLPSANYNSSFGGDPVPNTVKQLKVQYRINGKAGEASFPENATILLPVPK
ncbi:MAG: HEAT repeat domain-containing protein [Pirellulales bacterium]|nr:HEAT repeat domain-containing protein [Pirellulales bacterium]